MDVTDNDSFEKSDDEQDQKLPNNSKNMNNNCSIRTMHKYTTKTEHRPLVVRWRSPVTVPGRAGGMMSWPVHRRDPQRIHTTGLTSLLWRSEDFLRRQIIEVKKKPVLMDSYDRVKDEPLAHQLKLDIIRKVNDSVTTNNIMQVCPRSLTKDTGCHKLQRNFLLSCHLIFSWVPISII